MEDELRNFLITQVSAMQALVKALADKAAEADPGFDDRAREILMKGIPNADEPTATATLAALEQYLVR